MPSHMLGKCLYVEFHDVKCYMPSFMWSLIMVSFIKLSILCQVPVCLDVIRRTLVMMSVIVPSLVVLGSIMLSLIK
jgi:hypothetical protein